MNNNFQHNQIPRGAIGSYTCELSRAFLVYTPPQNNVCYRPLECHIQGHEMDMLINATHGGKSITPTTLATIAPQIISPMSTPADMVYIPEGLHSGRYAFYIELTRVTPMGREREIISGYTNYDGVSQSGFIDEQMVFHVNNRLLIQETDSVGVSGSQVLRGVRDANIVLNPVKGFNAFSMRPEDAVGYQQAELLRAGFGGGGVYDTRLTLDGIAKFGEIQHSIPGNYMSDLCNGYIKGSDPTLNMSDDEEYSNILQHVTNGNSHLYSAYVQELKDFTKASSFTYGDLNRRWPRQHDFWQVVRPRFNSTISLLDNTAYWDNAMLETNIAFSLTHILPGLMSKLMITKLDIGITNMTPGSQVSVVPVNWATMFEDTVTATQITYLIGQIEQHVIYGLIIPKAPVFDMFLSIDLLSNSIFDISLNGQPHIRYNAPMFCSSYYSPLIGLEEDTLRNIAGNMENISKQLIYAGSGSNAKAGIFSGPSRGHHTNNIPKVASSPIPNIVQSFNNSY